MKATMFNAHAQDHVTCA